MTDKPYLSIENVRTCLIRFLESDEASVIAIRGGWGVGKTHFWNELISEVVNTNLHESVKSYSYISLFGIDSLEGFKYAIFENTVPRSMIGKPITLESFSENVGKVSQILGKRALKTIFSTKPLNGFSRAVDSASFLSVRNTLICVDDMERKGEKLSSRDSLGLISYLKEHRCCKVVLLLNDGEDGMDEYIKYREKVIDIELEYRPSVKDNVDIAFDAQRGIFDIANEYACSLNSSNIRTLLKTKRYISILSATISDLEIEVQREVVSSVVLFCLCFYRAGNPLIPPLDYVANIGSKLFRIGGDKEIPENEKPWHKFLMSFGYRTTNQLDKVLARGVEAGFFDLEEVNKIATARNEEVLQHKSTQEFHDAWSLYHNTFEENEDQLVEELQRSLVRNAKTVSPTNLNGTVVLLRDLGREEIADKIIEQYVLARKDQPKVFDLNDYAFGGDVTDSKIREVFASEYEKIDSRPSLLDVLERLSTTNGWSPIDEEVLAESTPEDYVSIFDSERGEHLDQYVRVGLKFREWSNGNDVREKIGRNLEEALQIIGQRSRLNRRRVKKFGVIIEDDA
ncbi:P-loop NTPase fold protein [Halomonas sp. C22]|uniref:P-loop NTPase fold protein n=1 Tax=Halomonas sp. C22 TaxID=2580567 RepID=UPI0011A7DFD4|nr:P-loop NTPase fold protein [Halomonas sp. C22]